MNPLEQIREGLETKDFDMIATGYKFMTGKSVIIGSKVVESSESDLEIVETPKKRGRKPKVAAKTSTKVAPKEDKVLDVKNKFTKDGPVKAKKPILVADIPENIDKNIQKINRSLANKIKIHRGEERSASGDLMECNCGRVFSKMRYCSKTEFEDKKVVRIIRCPECTKEYRM